MTDMDDYGADEQLEAGKTMSDDELAGLLSAHEEQAVGYYTSEIADEQTLSLDYYYGKPFGDELEGRSSVVDRTVQIVVDNAVAALMKPFISSDDAVVFEPRGPEDEDAAKQATEYVNYVFSVDNNGFLLYHNWFKSALLEKLGIVKCWWEDSEEKTTQRLEGLDAQQVEQIISEAEAGDYEIIGGPYLDEEDGSFAVDIEREVRDGRVKIITVPSEEFLIAPFSRDIESAEYIAHRPTNVTRSDLLDMGFDPDVVDGLPAASSEVEYESRAQSRWGDENFDSGRSALGVGNDKSRDRISLVDEYVLTDYDGDGIAERRRVIRVGSEILFNEPCEDNPFAVVCPVPMPHKVYGQSLADQTRDLQRISSVLWRQTLDNLYLANNPKIEVPVNAVTPDGATYDDLEDPTPGGIVRTQAPGLLNPIVVPFVADKSFPMLQYVEQQQEARTGVSRVGQGLDANVLAKSGQTTAAEIAQIAEGKNARVELIARVFAETGVKRLFKLILKLLIKHQPKERMIRLRNQWVPIDPRGWNADMDLSVTVGLGVGSKVEQVGRADSVIATLAQVMQSPFASMVTEENAYHAVKRKLNATGVKDVESYITSPDQQQPKEPQPSPDMAKVMADQQNAQAKLQLDQQKAAADIQIQRERNDATLQMEREKAALQMELAQQKSQAEYDLAVQKMQMEAELAQLKMQMEARLAQHKTAVEAAVDVSTAGDQNISSYRPGGDLDQ